MRTAFSLGLIALFALSLSCTHPALHMPVPGADVRAEIDVNAHGRSWRVSDHGSVFLALTLLKLIGAQNGEEILTTSAVSPEFIIIVIPGSTRTRIELWTDSVSDGSGTWKLTSAQMQDLRQYLQIEQPNPPPAPRLIQPPGDRP